MISEDKLTGAEQKVLAAFRAGDTEVPVASAEIRGEFLRGLFLDSYDKKTDYRGTCIVGAIIPDALNLEFRETKFPVRFHKCYFAQKIKLQQLKCPELDFSGCSIEVGLDAKDVKVIGTVFLNNGFKTADHVSLFRADIGGQLICAKGSFQGRKENALNAQNIKVGSDMFLRCKFKGEVNLVGAEIGGQLNCRGGNFQNGGKIALNAQDIRVATNVFLDDRFVAVGAVQLAGADIREQLTCAGGNFQNANGYAINAQDIKVGGIIFLCDGFKAEGETSLLGANIGGQLNCGGGSFWNEGKISLNAQGIKVVGSVFLNHGFKAVGAVWLAGADIGGQLNCTGGNFQNKDKDANKNDNKDQFAINAQGIKVVGDVLLQDGFQARGSVSLLDADVGGQLSCKGGSFQNKEGNALVAQGIRVASGVFLIAHVHRETKVEENFSANGLVSFANATIGGNLMLYNCKLTHLSLAGANVLGEFRDDANIYKDQNGNDIVLDIDGFRYHRLNTTKESIENRLEWVGLMSKVDRFYPQPYEQLMKVYREMGHMNLARKAGFELERKRHKQLRLNRDHKRFVVLGWAWWMWYWVLRGTIGYGYKPFRAIARWFAPLIVAGLVLLSGTLPCLDPCRAGSDSCHCMAPSDAEVLLSADWKVHGKLPKDYPGFNPVYYAVEAALPVLPLGQTENWHPKTPWIRWVQGAITIIGALVLTILASYGVGVLGPRWKDG